jgi:hypothetical protein
MYAALHFGKELFSQSRETHYRAVIPKMDQCVKIVRRVQVPIAFGNLKINSRVPIPE